MRHIPYRSSITFDYELERQIAKEGKVLKTSAPFTFAFHLISDEYGLHGMPKVRGRTDNPFKN